MCLILFFPLWFPSLKPLQHKQTHTIFERKNVKNSTKYCHWKKKNLPLEWTWVNHLRTARTSSSGVGTRNKPSTLVAGAMTTHKYQLDCGYHLDMLSTPRSRLKLVLKKKNIQKWNLITKSILKGRFVVPRSSQGHGIKYPNMHKF